MKRSENLAAAHPQSTPRCRCVHCSRGRFSQSGQRSMRSTDSSWKPRAHLCNVMGECVWEACKLGVFIHFHCIRAVLSGLYLQSLECSFPCAVLCKAPCGHPERRVEGRVLHFIFGQQIRRLSAEVRSGS